MPIKENEIPPSHCPYCNATLDAATGINTEDKPSPGDLTVCVECQNICRFDENLQLRVATKEYLIRAFAAHPGLRRKMAAFQIIAHLYKLSKNAAQEHTQKPRTH